RPVIHISPASVMWHVLQSHSAFICTLFFCPDTAPTEIYTLSYTTLFRSLRCRHKTALLRSGSDNGEGIRPMFKTLSIAAFAAALDRKSTRLNSSHVKISYAVFCLKKKTKTMRH